MLNNIFNGYKKILTKEQNLHIAVCDYLDFKHKDVFYFHAHNESKRTKFEIYLASKMRLRSGIPDLIFPMARNYFYGLAIELKIKPNKLTVNQKKVLDILKENNWKTEVCFNLDSVIEVIENYF